MWKQGSLWNFILRRLARTQGFMDPVAFLSRLQRFGKPAEVWVPTELLRLGAILQARGVVNSQAIQHNLDWIWPFWVNRQFNPRDKGFIPRAFSVSHINLTHRNWTALGLPDYEEYSLVDPRGLVTPFMDGWSLDGWVVSDEERVLIPSRLPHVRQTLDYWNTLKVETQSSAHDIALMSRASMEVINGIPTCRIMYEAYAPFAARLVIALRPYNTEGVSFINDVSVLDDSLDGWIVNEDKKIFLKDVPDRYVFSNYHLGDVFHRVVADYPSKEAARDMTCPVGMAAAAAVYDLEPGVRRSVVVQVPLQQKPLAVMSSWDDHLQGHCEIEVPDKLFKSIYDISLRTLILHSPQGDIYPGPFTYKRFWFRDGAFIFNTMLTTGLLKNAERILDRFPSRQRADGYFMSQDGEWDSNGQAIWAMKRYADLTGRPLKQEWIDAILRGGQWIERKRVKTTEMSAHQGLLPAGFSAEHFGPNDYYYWDDFWGVAGLRAAASVADGRDPEMAQEFRRQAADLLQSIEDSLHLVELRLKSPAIPASPYRRMDTGAIGSLVVSYPLQLWDAADQRVTSTVRFLLENCFLRGAFYHEISHSGLNAYLTLHVAQALLRAGDFRFFDVVSAVAGLATPTGQWPEAIHPHTRGGCMGDGQHVWAAAEWLQMIRNMFVREEENIRTVILCSGVPPQWLRKGETLRFGYTATVYGRVMVSIVCADTIRVVCEAEWRGEPPTVDVRLPGYRPVTLKPGQTELHLKWEDQTTPVSSRLRACQEDEA